MRVFVILLAVSHFATRVLPSKSIAVEEKLADCIVNISATYLRTDLPLLVQTPDTWYERLRRMKEFSKKRNHGEKIIEALQKNSNVPIAVAGHIENLRYKTHNAMKPGSYLLILVGIRRNTFVMAQLMLTRMETDLRNNRAQVMIVTDYLPLHMAQMLLYMAYYYGYTEALVLNYHVDDIIYVVGWLPKHQRNLCQRLPLRTEVIDEWISVQRKFKENKNLFPIKRLVDIKNCTLRAGIDPDLLRMAPITYQLQKILLEDKIYRTYESVKNHFLLPFPYTNPRILEECVATYPHIREELRWYVPTGNTLPRWLGIFKAFSPALWLLAVFTFIMGTLVSYLLSVDRSFIKSAMNALLSHLVMGAEEKLAGVIAATFFTCWLFYCLHINTAYQASLFGYLVDPGEVSPVQTLEELEKSGLETNILYGIHEMFGNKYVNLTKCVGFTKCVSRIATKKDIGLLAFSSAMQTYAEHRRTADGKPFAVPLMENCETFYFTVLIKEDLRCLIRDYIDNEVTRYIEAGYLERTRNFLQTVSGWMRVNDTTTADAFAFSLSYLEGAFYVLLYGLSSAVIVFVGEVLCDKIVIPFGRKLADLTRPW